jgi:hypothetical protein
MTDFEKSIKRNMTCEKFDEIRDQPYADCEKFNEIRGQFYDDGKNIFPYKYGEVSSWLTWNRDENGQMAQVKPPTRWEIYDGPLDKWDDKYASRITTDIIFLGLNLAGDGKPFIGPSFQNARGEKVSFYTFFNTSAEGAYFTDIIKPDKRILDNVKKPSNGTAVKEFINNHPLGRECLKDNIRLFKEELDFIGAKTPLLIVFGDYDKWIREQGSEIISIDRFKAIINIWHYAYTKRPEISNEKYKNDTRKKLAQFITIP